MRIQSLNGTWEMETAAGERLEGTIPGSSYLFLIANHKIEDPFWGVNEAEAKKLAEQDFVFRRRFTCEVDGPNVDLVLTGVDTFAEISLNGAPLLNADNAFRTWRVPVRAYLRPGENLLEVLIRAPHARLRQKHAERPMGAGMGLGIPGLAHARKPQYSFGWDWGPSLPPAGIDGGVRLEAYAASLETLRLSQKHEGGRVDLTAHVEVSRPGTVRLEAVSPAGEVYAACREIEAAGDVSLTIDAPRLWWCNGMGDPALYEVRAALLDGETVLDEARRTVGLRTIELDTRPDAHGRQFCFKINGEPIFAKGADWIPADSFISRVTEEKLEFYIRAARDANMNMLRVWGGGYYESDAFYALCDRYGILVWQDFCFACSPYPFDETPFLQSVEAEVRDQVLRLHSHPSLALWSGNNEILLMDGPLLNRDKKLRRAVRDFFFRTLPAWVKALDADTPYWYGSPAGMEPGKKANALSEGDTHLWQIWHGLSPIEGYRQLPTRFCSEFGLESFPSMATIRDFTDAEDLSIAQKDIANHQKSAGGNEKILYYCIQRYGHPGSFEAMVYFSQLMQADGMRFAVEYWRRNRGRCNGALYWQYNDCWPVASWASVDYAGDFKALQHHARHFFAPTAVISELGAAGVDLWLVNDRPWSVEARLDWRCLRLDDGSVLAKGRVDAALAKESVRALPSLTYTELTGAAAREETVLVLTLTDRQGGDVLSRRVQLLVKDREARLPRTQLKTDASLIQIDGKDALEVTVSADAFAHIVRLEVEGAHGNFSDNFFDVLPGEPVTVTFPLPDGLEAREAIPRLRARSFADFPLRDDPAADRRFMKRMYRKSLPLRIAFRLLS